MTVDNNLAQVNPSEISGETTNVEKVIVAKPNMVSNSDKHDGLGGGENAVVADAKGDGGKGKESGEVDESDEVDETDTVKKRKGFIVRKV